MSIGFCEECGKPIHAGDAFCQGCGHALAGPSNTAKEFANASGESWFTGGFREGKAAKPLPAELHVQLWVTNSSQLTQQMGAADAGVVLDMLRGRAGKSGRNIGLLLDLAGDIGAGKVDWKEHVAVLRKVDQTLRETSGRSWDALCLVGDDKVLPMAILEDPTESDPQVETDACYASCSTANPWTEEAARFFWWAVGRLPVGKNWGVHPLANYFKNRDAAVSQAVSRGMPYGLSARCWEKASQAALQSLAGGLVQTSPHLDHVTLLERWDCQSPWQYFNLHGVMEEPSWYGDDGYEYPVVFKPELARRLESINVIGVEACYGARFAGLNEDTSILMASLSHRTVAFLGSSRIAFGPAAPPNCLADVMTRDFLHSMRKGANAGVAHQLARRVVLDEMKSPDMDPLLAIKTVLSFNLFGDPSVSMGLSLSGLARLDAPPRVVLTDPLTLVRSALTASMAETERRLQTQLAGRHPELREIKPKVSALNTADGVRHRWHWQAKVGPLTKHWLVLTDVKGHTRIEFQSR